MDAGLLGAGDLRALAARLGVAPTRSRGQNFVLDANVVRRAVALAGVLAGERVLEVGPGLGSLTLALLDAGASVVAVELDALLAAALPGTVAERMPAAADRLEVVVADAVRLQAADLPGQPPARMVANLPYNVAVPVLLGVLERLPSVRTALVMVQAEVGARLASPPGSRVYGVPSVKAAWWCDVRVVAKVARTVFWPAPRVDSVLVALLRRPVPLDPRTGEPAGEELRRRAFGLVDAAFGQRRKTLRSALGSALGSPARAEAVLRAAGIDPGARGETLDASGFARLAAWAAPGSS